MISHTYTYLFCDIRTHAILADLPVQSTTYSRKLSGIGEFSATLKINPDTVTLGAWLATSPAKISVYILRDNQVVWGGMITKHEYSTSSRELRIVGKGFEYYFYKRLQLTTKYWAEEDQLEIARWLVNNSGAAAAIGVTVSGAVSPRRRERTMFGYEFKTVGKELEQLSGLIDGFDWNVVSYRDPSTSAILRRLELNYPAAGQTRDTTNLFFEYPGAIRDFTVTEDAESSGNSIWAIGAGEGTEQVTANAQDYSQLVNGWPLLEESRSYKSVIRPSTLQEHADKDIQRLRTPVTVFTLDVEPDADPALGTYDLGDWARFKFEDDFFNPGIDTYARITGISVTVAPGTGIETVSLTLGGDEVQTESDQL